MTYKFKRAPESGLILVNVEIDNKYELKMILDTGATNTTIDSNALYLLGHDLKDNIGIVEIETANGIIETEVFEITVEKEKAILYELLTAIHTPNKLFDIEVKLYEQFKQDINLALWQSKKGYWYLFVNGETFEEKYGAVWIPNLSHRPRARV